MSVSGQQAAPEEVGLGSDAEDDAIDAPPVLQQPQPAQGTRTGGQGDALKPPQRRGPAVFRISLVKAFPFYGFCPTEKFFAKVFLFHPGSVLRAAHLLRTGAVMGIRFSVYEVCSKLFCFLCHCCLMCMWRRRMFRSGCSF